MDTHVPDTTLIPPLSRRRPEMMLPGEEGEQPPTSPAAAPTASPRGSRRGALLGSAVLLAVIVVGAGVFLVSPYNTILPLSMQSAVATARESAGNSMRHAAEGVGLLVAPAARMASVPPPVAAPAPAAREAVPRTTQEEQLDEVLAYRQRQSAAGSPPPSTLAAPQHPELVPPTADRRAIEPTPLARRLDNAPQGEPASLARRIDEPPRPMAPVGLIETPGVSALPVAPAAAVPSALAAAPAPTAMPQTASSAVGPGSTVITAAAPLVVVPPSPATLASPDPVTIGAALRPAPMSTPQEVDVLGLVTQLAVIMRNREERDRQMQADLAVMRAQWEAATADFGRRLALAEARGAMNAAMGAAAAPPPVPAIVAPQPASPAPPPAPVTVRTPVAVGVAPAANEGTRRRYRVQAASPGLAMLSEIDRTGEGGAQLQVAVGDEVPGYGKITGIAQQGSSWVVRAERGTIQ